MKKIFMAVVALAFATGGATAGVGIAWQTQWGVYDNTEIDLVGGSSALLDSYSAIWQLIYAGPDDAIDAPDLFNAANGYVGGDDDVWAQRSIPQNGGIAPEDGTSWDMWMVNDGVGDFLAYTDASWVTAGSFVYQRIFQGTPLDGSWYYDSGLLAVDESFVVGGTGTPQDFVIGPVAGQGIQPDQQIVAVPEPATMSLLGLGALVMAIRRRRS